MPIDKMFLDPMLDAFRQMAKSCQEAGHSGPDMDAMLGALQKMEEYGQSMDDIAAYSAKITTENLQMTFSNAYSGVLANASKAASSDSGSYDDAALLKQTVQAYKDARKQNLDSLEQAVAEAQDDATKNEVSILQDNEWLIKVLDEIIALGESGISLPAFLTKLIEMGLDKALEGQVASERGYQYALGWEKASSVSPYHVKEAEAILAKYQELSKSAPFNAPDSLQFELERKLIEHEFEPDKIKWYAVYDRFERLLDDLETWSTSFTGYAPHIDPWKLAADVKRAILQSQECIPGYFAVSQSIFKEYFGMDFLTAFKHPSIKWEIEHYRFSYSQEYTEFLIESIYPLCKPNGESPPKPSKDIIKRQEEFYHGNKMMNPELGKHGFIIQEYYDSQFGAGQYLKKFPAPVMVQSNAAKWDIASFKFC